MLSRLASLPVSRRVTSLGNLQTAALAVVALIGLAAVAVMWSGLQAYKDGQIKLETAFGVLQDAYTTEVLTLKVTHETASSARASIEGEMDEIRAEMARIRPLVAGDAEAELEFGHTDAAFAGLEAAFAAFYSGVDASVGMSEFTQLQDTMVAAADLVAVEADMLKDAFEEDMAQVAAATERLIWATVLGLVVFSAAAVAAGWHLSRRIGSGIAEEISGSVGQTQQLATGDLPVAITGTDKPGELGDLARALLVFRDNAVEAKRLEAEARRREAELRERDERQAEQQRAAEEKAAREREAARRATIADLAEKVGAVVKAAAEGDFTRRIDARLSDPELDEMARAINTLVESVEVAVAETARVMAGLTEGDLTRNMNGSFKGIFGRLQGDVNASLARLQEMVSQITHQCDGVSDAAATMKARSQDLARRAEQQAASLEETSANMEEIRQSVRSSTDGAASAAEFARKATERVEEAGRVVASAVEAMGQISEASRRIGDIVSVIDGIAFQTNLLALNAGVEAARAGESGRGFAVVASEVRALAQRSGDASKDIRTLIEESSTRVQDGVALVERTGRSLSEILAGVTQMSEIMQTLRQTAEEQAGNIGDVTDVIGRLDTITQKNAGLADETSNTAADMEVKVDAMRKVVATFRTGRSSGADTRHAGGPPARRIAAE